MLERFQVPEADKVIVREERVRSATEAVFRKLGLGASDAARAAEIMVLSDLRGHESHGVSNMLRRYVFDYGTGHINPDPQIRTLRESAVTATWDGDGGLGLQTGPWAMELAMEKAAKYGIGSVAVQNTRHLGMLAYYPLMAAKRDMIGVCMASAGGQLMVPIFGAEPRFGTHPMAWSAPARKMPPFVLDMATSQVAGNKLDLTRRIGSQLAPGWITKPDGTPIDEPVDVPEPGDFFMLPFGGTRERGGHKGYGIAVIVDIMSGILSGNRAGYFANDRYSQFVMAFNVEAFMDVDQFKDDMDEWMETLANTPPAPGHDRVLYAGLWEAEEEERRRANGIPYHREVIDWFNGISGELDLEFQLP